ncbi:MAG TPA: hypothetical protein VJT54_14490, partial [Verrucomicrobiae bacterium]|nr:hypothetical protein [Verrucomicrobiae bacterium]
YYSANNGATWTASTGGPSGTRSPVSDRVNGNKFYIYTSSSSGRLYVSTDGGASFSAGAVISASSSSLVPRTVFGHEGDLWLPRGTGGLARSTDSGSSFSTLATVQQATYVAFGRSATGQSYPAVFIIGQVAGVTGIFRSDDQGASWTRLNDDQHQFGLSWVHCFCADPRVYGRVYFGTEGRGIIYGEPAAPAPPEITLTTLPGNQLQLEWPQDYIGWHLQMQNNAPGEGLGTNWTDVLNSTSTNRVTVTVDTANASVFFRLASQ